MLYGGFEYFFRMGHLRIIDIGLNLIKKNMLFRPMGGKEDPLDVVLIIDESDSSLPVKRKNNERHVNWLFTGPGLIVDPISNMFATSCLFWKLEEPKEIQIHISNKIVHEPSKPKKIIYCGLIRCSLRLTKLQVINVLKKRGLFRQGTDITVLQIRKEDYLNFLSSKSFQSNTTTICCHGHCGQGILYVKKPTIRSCFCTC